MRRSAGLQACRGTADLKVRTTFNAKAHQGMAEAPGSRTQPPRVNGERPILKTGRATGPRSLPWTTVLRIAASRRTLRVRVRDDAQDLAGVAQVPQNHIGPGGAQFLHRMAPGRDR